MKKILIALAAFGLLILCFMGGCYGLSKMIFHKKDCESFNIDHIELRTGVDIPAVSSYDCNCKDNTKTSVFTIDTSKTNLEHYIERNKFVLTGNQYLHKGDNKFTSWEIQLNPSTAQLDVFIEYKQ